MTMKNGFSTINRLLGKHRESSNLSKSTTNLSVTKSTVNINESSQVHQNRITPLPIATSNAPFEQTFRITVLLPRDQLYVARLGAKVLLHKLLQLVCENKQLDPDKYEFQHPADPSQIFCCDLTIGAVGLSEIRLCNKSEYNDTFRSDDVSYRRNSFSSSKFSRNSKNISNTPSLYSSRNSLNSMSSSGIDSSNFRTSTPSEAGTPKYLAPVVPARKKRLAPRPPSQNLSLPENDVAHRTKSSEEMKNTQHPPESNLGQTLEQRIYGTNELNKSNLSIDCNGNTKGINGNYIEKRQQTSSAAVKTIDETFDLPSNIENISAINQPEPSPRRKVQTLPPKKKSVPVAPPRSTKSPTEKIGETQFAEEVPKAFTKLQVSPVALPRSTSSDNLISQPIEQLSVNNKNKSPEIAVNQDQNKNVSEIGVNENLIEETSSQAPDVLSPPVEIINSQSKDFVEDEGDECIDRSWNSSSIESSEIKHKSFIESSSEDDEMIKVYDLKLGKTIVKTLSNHKTSEVVVDGIVPNIKSEGTNDSNCPDASTGESSKSPNFDEDSLEKAVLHNTEMVTEIKKEAPEVNSLISEDHPVVNPIENPIENPVESQKSYVPSDEKEKQDNLIIEDKLSQQMEEQRTCEKFDNLPLKPESEEFPSEKKKIEIITSEKFPQLKQLQEITSLSETKQSIEDTDEKQQVSRVIIETKTNSTPLNTKQEPLISTLERLVGEDEELLNEQQASTKPAIQAKPAIQSKPSLATRSSSFLSLVQLEQLNNQRNNTTDEYFSRRRRSSSELSIGESPSLQSLGVIKSILNSRKNSISSTEESINHQRSPTTECDIQSMEEPSPKSNNILKTNNKLKTVEKVYRYSGPPNIQFSTWSDRPKVQVSIKNEQDCVVNGGGSKASNQNNKSTLVVNRDDLTPILRSNQNLSSTIPLVDDVFKGSTGRGALKETTSIYSNGREMNPSPTSTMPKFILGATRTSNQWPATSETSSTIVRNNNRPVSQPLFRSTSITRIISNPVIEQQNQQPAFGQVTLRKTGYKEKIVPLQDSNDVDVSKPVLPFAFKNQTNAQNTPKIITNKPNVRTEAAAPVSATTVPEAPPPPIIRAVVTKQKTSTINNNNNRTQILLAVDPRDQLLSAIRNFKRDELKNANI